MGIKVMDWGLLHLMGHNCGNFGLRPVPWVGNGLGQNGVF